MIIDEGRKIFEGSLKEMIENSTAITYEGIIEKSRISEIDPFGYILTNEKYDEEKVKVRFITQEPVYDPSFTKGEPDFLSSYVSLLKGGM